MYVLQIEHMLIAILLGFLSHFGSSTVFQDSISQINPSALGIPT